MWSASFKRAALTILLTGVLGAFSLPGSSVQGEPKNFEPQIPVIPEFEDPVQTKNILYALPLTITPNVNEPLDSGILDALTVEDGFLSTMVQFAKERSIPIIVDPYLLKSLSESPTLRHQAALDEILDSGVTLLTSPYASMPLESTENLEDYHRFVLGNMRDFALQSTSAAQDIFDALTPTAYLAQETLGEKGLQLFSTALDKILAEQGEDLLVEDPDTNPEEPTTGDRQTTPQQADNPDGNNENDSQQEEPGLEDEEELDPINFTEFSSKKVQIIINDSQALDLLQPPVGYRSENFDVIFRSEQESALLEDFVKGGETSILQNLIDTLTAESDIDVALIPNIQFNPELDEQGELQMVQLYRLLFAIESLESQQHFKTTPFHQIRTEYIAPVHSTDQNDSKEEISENQQTLYTMVRPIGSDEEETDVQKTLNAEHKKVSKFLNALTHPEPARAEYRLLLAQAQSAVAESGISQAEIDDRIAQYKEATENVYQAISLDAGSDITLITEEANFWVSVNNNLVSESSLVVHINSNNNRLVVPKSVSVVVDGHSKQSAIIPIRALSNGQTQLSISLHDTHGTQIGKTQTITASIHAEIELLVLIGFIVLVTGFIGAGILRSIIKRRKTPPSPELKV